MVLHAGRKQDPGSLFPCPDDMVRTFTQEEPISFETLGSQFFCTRRLCKTGTLHGQSLSFTLALYKKLIKLIEGGQSGIRDISFTTGGGV